MLLLLVVLVACSAPEPWPGGEHPIWGACGEGGAVPVWCLWAGDGHGADAGAVGAREGVRDGCAAWVVDSGGRGGAVPPLGLLPEVGVAAPQCHLVDTAVTPVVIMAFVTTTSHGAYCHTSHPPEPPR